MQKLIIRFVGLYVNIIAILSPKNAADIAINIFATPRKGKPTERQQKFLETAEQQVLHCDNLRIMTYLWKGSKDTVLLAHGWESNAGRWKALIRQLRASDYNVVAVDAPAHGQSNGSSFNAIVYAACMNEVVKNYSPSTIIGHSVGGMASVFMVHEHGKYKIKNLISLGAPAHFEGVLERYIELMGFSKRAYRAINELILERYGHKPDYYSAAEFMKDFSLKVLIIHDRRDSIIPFEDALLYKKHYPDTELVETRGLGHGLKDKFVYERILAFIDQS